MAAFDPRAWNLFRAAPLLVAAACGPQESPLDLPRGGDGERPSSAGWAGCILDSDCGRGEVCDLGTCEPEPYTAPCECCALPGDPGNESIEPRCSDPGYEPDPELPGQYGCYTDDECATGEACVEFECQAPVPIGPDCATPAPPPALEIPFSDDTTVLSLAFRGNQIAARTREQTAGGQLEERVERIDLDTLARRSAVLPGGFGAEDEVLLADFDGDGALDIVVPDASNDRWGIWRDGVATTEEVAPLHGYGALTTDLDPGLENGDEVVAFEETALSLFTGDDGLQLDTPSYQRGGFDFVNDVVDIGDVNGNGSTDLLVTNYDSFPHFVDLGANEVVQISVPPTTPNLLRISTDLHRQLGGELVAVGFTVANGRADMVVTTAPNLMGPWTVETMGWTPRTTEMYGHPHLLRIEDTSRLALVTLASGRIVSWSDVLDPRGCWSTLAEAEQLGNGAVAVRRGAPGALDALAITDGTSIRVYNP